MEFQLTTDFLSKLALELSITKPTSKLKLGNFVNIKAISMCSIFPGIYKHILSRLNLLLQNVIAVIPKCLILSMGLPCSE